MARETFVLAVHGGAGTMPREEMTAEQEALYRRDLEQALRAGYEVLLRPSGTSLDAVEAAIRVLEDSPRFNAGRGSVFTRDGRHELDAALMEGRDRRAGAVAGVTRVRNPIAAARAVMERSGHVFLAGPGADAFAEQCGLELVDPDYFRTERRWQALQAWLRRNPEDPAAPEHRRGTVGAVALDDRGTLAAGTSTGGTTGKRPGRVGDSPVVGAGLYAEDGACAVSCTGDGEHFLRLAAAHQVVALVRLGGLAVGEAAERVILGALKESGGEGGAIVLGAGGELAMPFNSEGMYRGAITLEGTVTTAIYREPAD